MDKEKSLRQTIFTMLLDGNLIFYGLFLAEVNKSFLPAKELPTACVGKGPGVSGISMFIGEDWWEKACDTEKKKIWTLVHEIEHVVREHLSDCVQGIYGDKNIANIAMDMSINQQIYRLEMPSPNSLGIEIVDINKFSKMGLAKNQSSLYYYNKLMEAKNAKNASKGKKDSMNPQLGKDNKRGTSGDPEFDKWMDNIDDKKVGDWHSKWEEITNGMSDNEKQVFRKQMQETIKRIGEETQKARGTLPSHIDNAIKENFGNKPPIISWKTLFNRFVGSTLTTDIYQNRKRPNFRFEDAPSNKYKVKIRVVVGIDSSGSVSDAELNEFFGQIKHMWKAGVKIDVCVWDAKVHQEYEYKGENTYSRVCQGGTYASSFIEHVNNNRSKKNWTVAINLTDGYIESNPINCKLPILWVITSNGSTNFNHHGKKIKIN